MPLTTQFLEQLRSEINTALNAVAQRHKLKRLETGHCRYDGGEGHFRFELLGVISDGLSREAASYESLRALMPNLPRLETPFFDEGIRYTIIGANTTGTKIHAKREADGKVYLYTPRFIVSLTNNKGAKPKKTR